MKVLNTNYSYKWWIVYQSVAHKQMIQKNIFFNVYVNKSVFIKSKLKQLKSGLINVCFSRKNSENYRYFLFFKIISFNSKNNKLTINS